ncbi:MAG: hypothetical protein EZS28_054576, partial [Streblomastix strix]
MLETSDEIRFISTAIRYDLREGMEDLTSTITQIGKDVVEQSQTALVIVMILSIILSLFSLMFNTLPWGFSMRAESCKSSRLIDLIPAEDNEKEM